MYYSQFSKFIKSSELDIQESVQFYTHIIQKTNDGNILIDNELTEFSTISEAKQYLNNTDLMHDIIIESKSEIYNNKHKIVNVIKETHDIKVTNDIVESYINLALNKEFTNDPVVYKLREMNTFDNVVNGKIHYILEDESVIAITPSTQEIINSKLKQNVIEFMKENSNNFLKILNVILKE
jgi:hypothetical protein